VITDKLHAEPWWTHGPTMKLMLSEYLKYMAARMRMRLDPAATARTAASAGAAGAASPTALATFDRRDRHSIT
jgi:hypothetical protein